jgi:hypothetical protein
MDVTNYEFVSIKDIYELIIKKELKKPIPWIFFDNLNDNLKRDANTIIYPLLIDHSLLSALFEAAKKQYDLNEESSEPDVSFAVQPLLIETIRGYADLHHMSSRFTFGTDQIDETAIATDYSQSLYLSRDFVCYLDEIPIIIGEEEASDHDIINCVQQLEENVGLMSPLFYNKIPFVLCYAAAGKYLKFFAYVRQCN